MHANLIDNTISFVKEELKNAEGGHDWFHIERVYKSAIEINRKENGEELVVRLAALLHDIADSKFNNGDEEVGPNKAEEFLKSIHVHEEIISHVKLIIQNMSFKNSLVSWVSAVMFRFIILSSFSQRVSLKLPISPKPALLIR